MTPDLRALLQDAVPEPDRSLDPAAVLHTARRRQRTRAVALVAAAVLVVGAAGAALVPGPWRHRAVVDPAAVPLTVSALADRQPAPPGVAGENATHPGEAALVGTVGPDGATKVWLSDTRDDQLCLAVATDDDGSGGGCQPRRELLRTGLTMPYWPDSTRGPVWVIVVAPDGYTTASAGGVRATFRENTAVVALDHRPPASGALTISGPDLPDVAFPLEDVIGPEPPPPGADLKVYTTTNLLKELSREARRYAEDHGGSTSGFAASLPADFRQRMARNKITITDTSASRSVNGHCLAVVLATGEVTDRAC